MNHSLQSAFIRSGSFPKLEGLNFEVKPVSCLKRLNFEVKPFAQTKWLKFEVEPKVRMKIVGLGGLPTNFQQVVTSRLALVSNFSANVYSEVETIETPGLGPLKVTRNHWKKPGS